MFNITSIFDAVTDASYAFQIVKQGISSSSTVESVVAVGAVALGMVSTACLMNRAICSESGRSKVGYGLLALGSHTLTAIVAGKVWDVSLKRGCIEIVKEFGASIPSYSPCRQFNYIITQCIKPQPPL